MTLNTKDLKLRSEQNALLTRVERLQARANLILASASVIQEYTVLAQQMVAHIAALNAYAPNPLTIPDPVQAKPQREGPSGSDSGPGCAGEPGNQAKRTTES